jgi:hydrophobic/amphiphilic exporter-1 (mainly G- bacteria), HAE1 family
MIVDAFIKRPRLASVVSIVLVLGGLLAIRAIPLEQYPDITPPQVSVSAVYPGASSDVVEEAVALPIETAVNGVKGMTYMSSSSGDDGSYSLTITFEVGTDPDIASVNVQNRIKTVESKLPSEVIQQGVSVTPKQSSFLQMLQVYSPDGRYDGSFLTNYVNLYMKDELARATGVGDVHVFSTLDYSMRVWLDNDRLKALKLSTADILNAIRGQNIQAAVGRIGSMPVENNQLFQISLTTQGRFKTVKDFEDIIIRANPDGSYLLLKDVARVELGAKSEELQTFYNGTPSTGIAIFQTPGSNAVEAAASINQVLQNLKKSMPEGIEIETMYDAAEFVSDSIYEIAETLVEGFILVILIIYLFLGSLKTTLIPMVVIPVALIGAFIGMIAMGVSANTISLLALVLAIGIVVDDAIVVVEDVESVMAEHPEMSPGKAVSYSMSRISAAVVATGLVMLAVFVPVALVPGISGILYRQFAISISGAMLISVLNALTLSPALARILMRPQKTTPPKFVRLFMSMIDILRNGYSTMVRWLVPYSFWIIPAMAGVFALLWFMFKTTPQGFLPAEDRGVVMIEVQLPSGASWNRTKKIVDEVSSRVSAIDGVQSIMSVVGAGMMNNVQSSNSAFLIAKLLPYDERKTAESSADGIIRQVWAKTADIKEAIVIPFNLPALMGASSTDGFEYILQTTEGNAPEEILLEAQRLIAEAKNYQQIQNVLTLYKTDAPRIKLDIDRKKAYALGVPISEVFNSLQTVLGGMYVNDFSYMGRNWDVRVQGDIKERSSVDDIFKINVRNDKGEMIPLRSFVSVSRTLGAQSVQRFNNYRSVTLNGSAATGYSSGNAIQAMEDLSAEILPSGYKFEWAGTSRQEKEAAGQTLYVFAMAIVFSYLFLVSLYESWVIPIPIILSVAVGLTGALMTLYFTGTTDDIYAQIGMVVLISLAAKNAILLVEFAQEEHLSGKSIEEAAVNASHLRFRAIMMTAISSLMGFIPLLTATGAGALSRRAIGMGIFGGLAVSSSIGIFFIPLLYVVFQKVSEFFWGMPKKEDF